MKPTKTHLLFELARRGCAVSSVRVTTIELARALRVSQQTASRWLNELSCEGLVLREGKNARLTKQARAEIEWLAKALEAKPVLPAKKKVLRGVVVRGLGEGAKFMRLPRYARELRAALGWTPFPGTLNLKLDEKSASVKKQLESERGLLVRSFVYGKKRFGSVKLFPCVVRSRGREERGAVIIPENSFYGENILEVIAEKNLRRALRLTESPCNNVLVKVEFKFPR
ncbi:MAG: DUF120 domain-containing protein [Candidatus Norongarragalinales archaeon]